MKLASNQIQFAHVEFQPVVISITYKIAQRIKISICMKIACLYVVMNDNHLRRSQEEEHSALSTNTLKLSVKVVAINAAPCTHELWMGALLCHLVLGRYLGKAMCRA